MEVEKKIWPKYFKEIKKGNKKVEYRLADFKLKEGDILVLREWDPQTKKYTGRVLKKKVLQILKKNPFDYYTEKDLKKYGLYLILLK